MTNDINKEAANKMTKARVYLLKNKPFFGKLAMDLDFVESKDDLKKIISLIDNKMK